MSLELAIQSLSVVPLLKLSNQLGDLGRGTLYHHFCLLYALNICLEALNPYIPTKDLDFILDVEETTLLIWHLQMMFFYSHMLILIQ